MKLRIVSIVSHIYVTLKVGQRVGTLKAACVAYIVHLNRKRNGVGSIPAAG